VVNAFVCIFNEKKIYPLSSKGGVLLVTPILGLSRGCLSSWLCFSLDYPRGPFLLDLFY